MSCGAKVLGMWSNFDPHEQDCSTWTFLLHGNVRDKFHVCSPLGWLEFLRLFTDGRLLVLATNVVQARSILLAIDDQQHFEEKLKHLPGQADQSRDSDQVRQN